MNRCACHLEVSNGQQLYIYERWMDLCKSEGITPDTPDGPTFGPLKLRICAYSRWIIWLPPKSTVRGVRTRAQICPPNVLRHNRYWPLLTITANRKHVSNKIDFRQLYMARS